MSRVAVVTDSSSTVPAATARHLRVSVVPLQVVVDGRCYDDGVAQEASPAAVARALRAHVSVTTSRPSPAAVLEAYQRLAEDGVQEIVSVHLSGEVSATCESARLAAEESPVPVHVVDSRQIGAATGYAVVTAAELAAAGGTAAEVARAARDRAERTASLFYVDTLEHLRRGGRVGAAAALLGSALAVKPILTVVDGRISPLEKVRTSVRALARLEDLAAQAASGPSVEVTVCHLEAEENARRLAGSLAERLAPVLHGQVRVAEVPAVLGAHVGPGLIGVAVAPR